ncbi:MAG: 30S ribosomal protein S8 [Candidatus Falkowbacteria bacterium GW2011_GWC2_38_22]|uniref:Small ribosomal subunit protein uS8 n=1 Tax=Candidatus Falkowbacteria bacterium GW2011_GWE1_38_31 TaxID=1618638 RepID=A0A0G0MYQ8_9BACT|nr:MAG: 30S ribosomal protein S8 [Candidatus Falkowbacteria bacterium GW2011_GWF2_38_1205]KKQ61178.1 MAG: 30S ribosomal protein S8 [Candidatus Falkowbacteria bacterium GW2011_GWC2_38_22]KKQ63314.1 MAG: 30S ribosomal protein S8 [Candidatus Falkowbacteria bacterium GW2011_GWF1_38_22]KKQ65568.1 MAG: 30S ribosomal protein S8 [Candidatus Falkowbacteria bacterium GW2011_GWE2_38_254]KKQ70046.1 MAG: 30S ribosomal protein S8 [Candidatus Falkowbacteria bacterium GW2011_GWE1_38_31]KKQ72713.1 MAG: 30S rib
MIDPIADMLTRIRNASAVAKQDVVLPMSKIKFEIAKILKSEGWINDVEVLKTGKGKRATTVFDELRIVLKYKKNSISVITNIKRISKPGLKIYANKENLPRVLNNAGIAILSTPQGLMTNKEARKKGMGGEVLCEIY